MQATGAVDIPVARGAEHSAVAHRPAAESMRRRIVRAIGLGFDMMPPTPRKSSVMPRAAPASRHSAQHGWARTTTRAAITRTCAAGRPARPRRAHRVGIARLVGELRRFTRRRRIFCRSVAGGLRVRFHGAFCGLRPKGAGRSSIPFRALVSNLRPTSKFPFESSDGRKPAEPPSRNNGRSSGLGCRREIGNQGESKDGWKATRRLRAAGR